MNNQGFTIIELLVSIAALAIIAAAGLAVSFDAYRAALVDQEKNTLGALFTEARDLSLENYYDTDHGIYLAQDHYALFSGIYQEENHSDQYTPRNQNIIISGPKSITFSAGTGMPNQAATFVLSYGQSSSTLTLFSDGSTLY